MISVNRQPSEPLDTRRGGSSSGLLLRYRFTQLAFVVALAVSGMLLWDQQSELAAHRQRMEQLDRLVADAGAQRDRATELLETAREILASTHKNAAEATPNAGPTLTPKAQPATAAPATPPEPASPGDHPAP